MMHDDTVTENTQLSLSYELLALLHWLALHDADKLKRIVVRALKNGLGNEIKKESSDASLADGDIQNSIVDFLSTLETILFDAINEQTVKKALEKNLMPAIDQIDTSVCDDATVRFSVEKATTHAEDNNKEAPKDMLFKELLKRWKPNNKTILN